MSLHNAADVCENEIITFDGYFCTTDLYVLVTCTCKQHAWFQVEEYSDTLDDIMVKRDDGIRVMPELYVVPMEKVRFYASRVTDVIFLCYC